MEKFRGFYDTFLDRASGFGLAQFVAIVTGTLAWTFFACVTISDNFVLQPASFDPELCKTMTNEEIYDQLEYPNRSISDRYMLYCNRLDLVGIPTFAFYGGWILSIPFGTAYADAVGRRPALIITNVATFMLPFLMTLAPSFPIFCVLRFMCGVGLGIKSIIAYVACSEFSPTSFNPAITGWLHTVFVFAQWLIIYIAATAGREDYRPVLLAVSLVGAVELTQIVLFQHESPRWLLSVIARAGKGAGLDDVSKLRALGVSGETSAVDPNTLLVSDTDSHISGWGGALWRSIAGIPLFSDTFQMGNGALQRLGVVLRWTVAANSVFPSIKLGRVVIQPHAAKCRDADGVAADTAAAAGGAVVSVGLDGPLNAAGGEAGGAATEMFDDIDVSAERTCGLRWYTTESHNARVDATVTMTARLQATHLATRHGVITSAGDGRAVEAELRCDGASDSLAKALCAHGEILLRTLAQVVLWFGTSAVYWILSLSAGSLAGDMYFNAALLASAELPGGLLASIIQNKWGSRWPCIILSLIAAAALAGMGGVQVYDRHVEALPPAADQAVRVLALVSKGLVAITFTIIYPWGAELLPSSIRSSGLGVSSGSARLGIFLAVPLRMLRRTHVYGPPLILSVLAVGAALAAASLPETMGVPSCDTVKDAMAPGQPRSPFLKWWRGDRTVEERRRSRAATDDARAPLLG